MNTFFKFFSALFICVSILLNLNCSKNSNSETVASFNGNTIKSLASNAIKGDKGANQKLQLFDPGMIPVPQMPDNFIVDSLKIENKMFFYCLLQFPDPEYNRLAFYDNKGQLLLLDKSLNGELSLAFEDVEGVRNLQVVESFISKDALSLKRLSYYRLEPNLVRLSFRSFFTLAAPDAFFSQDITKINKDTIVTSISIPSKLAGNVASSDTFIYDNSFGKYISKKNIFNEVVKQQVNSFNISKAPNKK
ncbi:MAG: hypothetical protein ACM34K_21315 [Bacillota bacterium]